MGGQAQKQLLCLNLVMDTLVIQAYANHSALLPSILGLMRSWQRSTSCSAVAEGRAPTHVCLVAGKSTLLQILAGQYMVGPDTVRILGRPAFHDIQLTSSGQLSYLGQQWRRDIAFAGYNVPIQVCKIWKPSSVPL